MNKKKWNSPLREKIYSKINILSTKISTFLIEFFKQTKFLTDSRNDPPSQHFLIPIQHSGLSSCRCGYCVRKCKRIFFEKSGK